MIGPLRQISKLEYDHIGIGKPLAGDDEKYFLTEQEADLITSETFRKQFVTKINSKISALEWFRRSEKSGNKTVRTGCWVGVLALKDVHIEVRPKIEDKDKNISKVNLVEMLNYCYDLGLPKELSSKVGTTDSILEIFAQAFGARVIKIAQRGLPHRYINSHQVLNTLKGRIDIQKQISLDSKASTQLACVYNSFECDNTINQLLKSGIRAAFSLTKSDSTKRILRQASIYFEDVDDSKLTSYQIDRLVLNRNELYLEAVRNLARFFTLKQSFDVRLNNVQHQGFAMMFRMWNIYEQYAVKKLNESFKGTIFKAIAHQENANWYISNERKFKKLKPDIVIRNSETNEILYIVDTKWKKLPDPDEESQDQESDNYSDVSSGDAYQAIAYSATLSNIQNRNLKSHHYIPVSILYPVIGDNSESITLRKPEMSDPLSALRKADDSNGVLKITAFLNNDKGKSSAQDGYAGTISILRMPCPRLDSN
jgi:5-methylcytosine-specific restriction enzyme subunit McrC